MQYNRIWRPFLLFLLCFFPCISSAAINAGAMEDLRISLTNLPSDWKGTNFCHWSGMSCQSGNVTALNLAEKSLSGRLPDSFGQLTSLQSLNLQHNRISGDLPSFAGMSSLQTLNLDTNAFSSIPRGFFYGLTSLDNNPFSPWPLPDELSKCDSLRNFFASNANISSPIPAFFGNLSSLVNLCLSYNNLTWGLPDSFANSSIKKLYLDNQKSSQKLTGGISILGAMEQLSLVWLQSNSFSDPIPDVSNLTSLAFFIVNDNQLTSMVPHSLAACPTLWSTYLANNHLQGPFPTFSHAVTSVTIGKGNNFCNREGDVGQPCDPRVMVLLSVALGFGYPQTLAANWQGNNLCVGGWFGVVCDTKGKDIIVLNFANLHFAGTISPDIANITSLTKLLLSDNNLTGPLPDSLATLKNLQLLDVSNNDLTGLVPTFDKSVMVKIRGNPRIGTQPGSGPSSPTSSGGGGQPSGKSKSSTGWMVGVVLYVIVLVNISNCIIRVMQLI